MQPGDWECVCELPRPVTKEVPRGRWRRGVLRGLRFPKEPAGGQAVGCGRERGIAGGGGHLPQLARAGAVVRIAMLRRKALQVSAPARSPAACALSEWAKTQHNCASIIILGAARNPVR